MKILIAADGSDYTKRLLAYIAAHDEWLGAMHQYTVFHCVREVPERAQADRGPVLVDEPYDPVCEHAVRRAEEGTGGAVAVNDGG